MKNRLLRAMLALLLSAGGYTWITRLIENPGSNAVSTSPGVSAQSIDRRSMPQSSTTVPGELKIYTATPEYFRILGLSTRADEYPSLSLVIDRGRYRLTGRIVDERSMPVASERITLKSEIDGGEYRSQASRAGNSDASGYFEFSGLGGIDHTLGVYANGYKPHIEYHQFQSFSDHLEIRLRR